MGGSDEERSCLESPEKAPPLPGPGSKARGKTASNDLYEL